MSLKWGCQDSIEFYFRYLNNLLITLFYPFVEMMRNEVEVMRTTGGMNE